MPSRASRVGRRLLLMVAVVVVVEQKSVDTRGLSCVDCCRPCKMMMMSRRASYSFKLGIQEHIAQSYAAGPEDGKHRTDTQISWTMLLVKGGEGSVTLASIGAC